jgi:Tol biopolymer transport system component
LYFSSDRGGTVNLWRVRISSSTGGALEPLEPVTTPNVNAVHASLSKDGRRLVYATYTWNTDVFSAAFDPVKLEVQGAPTWLLGGSHLWTAARISPDASQLALVRWSQQQDMFLFFMDGGGIRRVTSDPLGVRCRGVRKSDCRTYGSDSR